MFNCGQLKRVNSALDTLCSTGLDYCLTNGVFGEIGKDLLRLSGLAIIDEGYLNVAKYICYVLIDVANVEHELDARIKDDR